MAWTSAWLQSIFAKYSKKKIESKKIILFNNSPIGSNDDDVFDSKIKVNAIRQAITEENATTIALIGEYGTGKSSLTNLLYKENEDLFEKPSYINLWDCVCKKEKSVIDNGQKEESVLDNQSRINSFTKSFLYQLSTSARNKGFSKYINQRLSKNYGKVSLSSSGSKISIILILFALLAFILYIGFNKINYNISFSDFSIPNEFFLLIALPCIYFAAKTDNFLFSLWDSQGKIEPTDTDTFEIFKEICNKLKTEKKRLIIIEDLDRTDDALIVTSLLKEIYRFINLLKDDKDKFIFIISLKSEESLVINNTDEEHKKGLNIYSKIFDYSVWIRPLYFENIREIVEQLLKDKCSPEDKTKILPNLYWIMQGHALTVREIKDRLNEVFLLYDSLSQRDNYEADIQYNKCAAVVYLQRQYPLEFQRLISHEQLFAEIVKNYYYDRKLPEQTSFSEIMKENTSDSFFDQFIEMLKSKDIENDYAMYFFNYPKNSKIMSLEERYIYDSIIHNVYSPYETDSINEMIDNIIRNKNSNEEDNVITKALKQLIEYNHFYQEFVFEHERIFEMALQTSQDHILISLSQYIKDNINSSNPIYFLERITEFNFVKTNKLLRQTILKIPVSEVNIEYAKTKNKGLITRWRTDLIKTFPNDIELFSDLFNRNDYPIVELGTLSLLNTTKDIFYCLNFNAITQKTFKSYLEFLCKKHFKNEETKYLIDGLLSIPSLSTMPNSHILLRDILMKNKVYEESLYEIIFSGYKQAEDNKSIIDYVQSIDFSKMSDNMLIKLDELITNEITDLSLIKLLESKGLYQSAIYSRLSINNFNTFNFKNTWISDHIDALGTIINENNKELLLLLRTVFIKNKAISNICSLFDEPFDFVSEQELQLMNEPDSLYYATDFSRVTNANCNIFANYCNTNKFNDNKLFAFFKALFFQEDNSHRIISEEIINLILEKIDFNNCLFGSMDIDQQNEIIEVFTPILGLDDVNKAISFMKIINCHIENLNNLIQNNIESEDDDLFIDYIDCCNSISVTPETVINFLAEKNINTQLKPEITTKLYQKEKYTQYIIGKSLNDNVIVHDDTIPLSNYYKAYSISDKFYELTKNNVLVEKFYKENMYDSNLTIDRLEPFMKFEKQPCKLIQIILTKLGTDEEKKQYFSEIPDIQSYKECEKVISLFTQEPFIDLFHNDVGFREIVKEKLYERDDNGNLRKGVLKTKFTKALNAALLKKYGSIS
ncbi:MAG: hypothetical protein J6X78_06490 [Treponema sp.]|nr:hypothetical protein [Treponema sp.]